MSNITTGYCAVLTCTVSSTKGVGRVPVSLTVGGVDADDVTGAGDQINDDVLPVTSVSGVLVFVISAGRAPADLISSYGTIGVYWLLPRHCYGAVCC